MGHEFKHGGSQTLVDEQAGQSALTGHKHSARVIVSRAAVNPQREMGTQEREDNGCSAHGRTFRSVLRTQMKVHTDGLLLDLRTTNPPGPFSPLMAPSRGRTLKTESAASLPTGWKWALT